MIRRLRIEADSHLMALVRETAEREHLSLSAVVEAALWRYVKRPARAESGLLARLLRIEQAHGLSLAQSLLSLAPFGVEAAEHLTEDAVLSHATPDALTGFAAIYEVNANWLLTGSGPLQAAEVLAASEVVDLLSRLMLSGEIIGLTVADIASDYLCIVRRRHPRLLGQSAFTTKTLLLRTPQDAAELYAFAQKAKAEMGLSFLELDVLSVASDVADAFTTGNLHAAEMIQHGEVSSLPEAEVELEAFKRLRRQLSAGAGSYAN